MTVVAGVDIGNATTEIVIADHNGRPLAWDRMATQGDKASARSGDAAARLLARMQRRTGLAVDAAFLTPQVPVRTRAREVDSEPPDTGRLLLLGHGPATPGGVGHGAGRPMPLESAPTEGPEDVVLVATHPLDFRATVARVTTWRAAGAPVRGLLLAGDEAQLVAARIDGALPIVDCVDPSAALSCDRITLEVAPPGREVTRLTDPIALAADLSLGAAEHASARVIAARARGARAVAVGVLASAPAPASGDRAPGDRASGERDAGEDRWSVDLGDIARLPGLRPGAVLRPRVLEAIMAAGADSTHHIDAFSAAWAGEVRIVSSEPAAGRRGALTTPGARPSAVVIDLGGGTIDVSTGQLSRSGAGSGDLLTRAVADIIGTGQGMAEWVKRSPSSRIEAPHLALRETGGRDFLDPAAPHGTVGWLVAPGPSGPIPFTRDLSPSEWRTLRQAAKQAVIAGNLARLLPSIPTDSDVLLVGGPAGDDEIVDLVNAALPDLVAGRANVAGELGHRWAVAYGLVLEGLDRGL